MQINRPSFDLIKNETAHAVQTVKPETKRAKEKSTGLFASFCVLVPWGVKQTLLQETVTICPLVLTIPEQSG